MSLKDRRVMIGEGVINYSKMQTLLNLTGCVIKGTNWMLTFDGVRESKKMRVRVYASRVATLGFQDTNGVIYHFYESIPPSELASQVGEIGIKIDWSPLATKGEDDG